MMCYILYQVSPLLPHGYPPHRSSEKPIRGRIRHANLYFFCITVCTLFLRLSSAFSSPPKFYVNLHISLCFYIFRTKKKRILRNLILKIHFTVLLFRSSRLNIKFYINARSSAIVSTVNSYFRPSIIFTLGSPATNGSIPRSQSSTRSVYGFSALQTGIF